MHKLNRELLAQVKAAFVPMPGGMSEPVAGASPMTAAMGAPMGLDAPVDPNSVAGTPTVDPAMMGGDPMAGMPADPNAMPADPNAAPVDPNAAAGAPPVDPMAGMPPTGQIILTPTEFIQIIAAIKGEASAAAPAPGAPAEAKPKSGTAAKLDEILMHLKGGQPAAPAAV